MATSKKSLASRAGSVVRRAVRGRSATAADGTGGASAADRQTTAPAEEKTAAKKAAAKKTAAKKTAAKKTPAKKTPAKKTPAKKTPAKKTAAKKTAAKKAPAETKAPATEVAAKKTATKKSAAKKSAATKTAAKKASAEKTTAAKKTVAKKAPAAKKTAAKKTAAKKTAAKKTAAKKTASSQVAGGSGAGALVVREGEDPWTEAELGEVRGHLQGDVDRLVAELETADSGLHDLMVDSGDGSGHDQADVGSSSFERDHELSIANNARDMLDQSRHALERIADGSYGVCERNGEPIGKLRLMAFPRATLCMTCKQREERR